MIYCCDAFKNLVNNIGKKGISIIPINEYGYKYFNLQWRSLDKKDEKIFDENIKHTQIDCNMYLSLQTTINYCPFCGYKLANLIMKNESEFNDLVNKYKNLSKL